MSQAGPGRIELFEDFFGVGDYVALTLDSTNIGPFLAGGEGFEDADAGIAPNASLHGGVVTLTGANTDVDMTFIGTPVTFDVATMGTIVAETRIQMPDLDTKIVFFGATSVLTSDEQIDDIIDAGTTTITLAAGSLAGFLFSDELTEDEMWHMPHKGGSTAASTVSTAVESGVDAVAGEWDVLRLEIDNNGTCRWYVNGVLKQTVTGAVSTTTDLAIALCAGANTTELAVVECDYLLVRANRDWTR